MAGRVLAFKGNKNMYEVGRGLAIESIRTVLVLSVSGIMRPPMLIYPYKRMPSEIIQSSWTLECKTLPYWMDDIKVFNEFIGNVFNPHLGQYKVKFPLNLYAYGHRNRLRFQLCELCSEWAKSLISLSPNATRPLQTLEVAAFRPMKLGWKRAVLD